MVFDRGKLILFNGVIVLSGFVVDSMEINRSHYFRNIPYTFRLYPKNDHVLTEDMDDEKFNEGIEASKKDAMPILNIIMENKNNCFDHNGCNNPPPCISHGKMKLNKISKKHDDDTNCNRNIVGIVNALMSFKLIDMYYRILVYTLDFWLGALHFNCNLKFIKMIIIISSACRNSIV